MTTTATVLYVGAASGDDGDLERLEASFDVDVVDGAVDVLKRLRTRPAPDAIVTPATLPDLPFESFLEETRAAAPTAAVVVVGDPSIDASAVGALAEADAYVTPDRAEGLVSRLAGVLARRRVDRAVDRHDRLTRAVEAMAVDAARAADRAAVEAAFHDRLVGEDWFRHVWVVRLEDGGRTVVLPVAGRLGDDELATLVGGDQVDFVDRAVETGRVTTRRSEVPTRAAATTPVSASDGDSRVTLSTAAVPFVREGRVHGLGLLATDRVDAFDSAERALLEDVGAILGHALSALDPEASADSPGTGRGMENLVHDLRNPLGIARSHLEIAREDDDLSSLGPVEDALDRMVETVDRVAAGVGGEPGIDVAPDDLSAAAETAWDTVAAGEATLDVEPATIRADHDLLVRLLANLFQNAVDHGGEAVTVRVGPTPQGFYVEDDGEGIPERERASVVERGYSTSNDGLGIGLSIVQDVADAHGWTLTVAEGTEGGARFELSGVERLEERETT